MNDYLALPFDLPAPVDDGACRHLTGTAMPDIALPSTTGVIVHLKNQRVARRIIYCYPRTGQPGKALPVGWDEIPGARGCTPQACNIRDHHGELLARGVEVFGLSTQSVLYQQELAVRLHLPFALLSDHEHLLCGALQLPTFTVAGERLIKRLTLVVRDGTIEKVFYPVFPPDQHAVEILRWLDEHSL